MKKLFFLCSAVMGLVALLSIKFNGLKQSDITMANVLSIAAAQAEGTGNTGPASYHDCAGIGTGTYKECDCYNANECTPHPCQ